MWYLAATLRSGCSQTSTAGALPGWKAPKEPSELFSNNIQTTANGKLERGAGTYIYQIYEQEGVVKGGTRTLNRYVLRADLRPIETITSLFPPRPVT